MSGPRARSGGVQEGQGLRRSRWDDGSRVSHANRMQQVHHLNAELVQTLKLNPACVLEVGLKPHPFASLNDAIVPKYHVVSLADDIPDYVA